MKKFRPSRNGHLASCNDFFWMQDSYFEGFNALIYSLIPNGVDRCILSGCELTIVDEEYVITDGYVYYAQEIFYVNESSGTFEPGEIPCFVLIESDGPLNPVKNIKGETVSVHFEREMELQFLPEANEFEYDESSKITDLLLERLGIADQDARIEDLEDAKTDHEERVNQLEVDVTNLEMAVTDHNARIIHLEGLEDNIDQLETSVANSEQSISDHEERISQLEVDVTGIEGVVTEHNTKILTMGPDLDELKTHLDLLSTNQGLTGSQQGDHTGTMTLINSDFTDSDLFWLNKTSFSGFKRRTLLGWVTFACLREGSDDDNFTASIFCNDERVGAGNFRARGAHQMVTLPFSKVFTLPPTSNQITISISIIRASGNFFITPLNSMGYNWVII